MIMAERNAAFSGLETARRLIGQGRPPGIGETLDFELISIADGSAVCGGTPGPHAYNPLGVVHGGYAATLLDTACGFAVMSKLTGDQSYTTIELKVSYHKAMRASTGPVRASGRVITMGRKVAFAEASLTDGKGVIYASATSSLLILDAR